MSFPFQWRFCLKNKGEFYYLSKWKTDVIASFKITKFLEKSTLSQGVLEGIETYITVKVWESSGDGV